MSNISIGQYRKFLELLDQKDVNSERFQALLPFLGILCDSAADLSNVDAFRASLKLGALVSDVFRLTVDYGQTLEQMIAAGNYDWENDDITSKRFPVKGDGIVEFEGRYFHFNREISSENAIKEIEAADVANPWSPAKIEHVLSHGRTFPEEQRKFPVIGLGSVAEVDGRRFVPGLSRGGSGRSLGLRWFDDGWGSRCRVLAVRKVSGS